MIPTVFVIDDDPSLLRGLSRLLKSQGHAVEAFASATLFLEKPPVDRPGCILVDLRMPEMGGLELQQHLAGAGVNLPVIFISGASDVPSTVSAFRGGALDFLIKPFEDAALMEAVSRALSLDAEQRAAGVRRQVVESRFAALTPREHEVCLLVARGMLNKQIAFELGAAEKTVKVHRARIMQKLGVASVAELVRMVDQRSQKN